MEQEIVSRIGKNVESADDLLKYARAVRMLQPTREVGKFWHSESFYKFLGAALGSVVAAVALIASGFVSTTSTLVASAMSGLEIAEKNRVENEESMKLAAAQVARVETELASLSEKNAVLERRARALAQANSDAAEDLAKARGEIRSIIYQSSVRESELSELERQIAEAKRLASNERIAGSVIAICDVSTISHWYRKVSSLRNADPAIFNPAKMSLTLFLVQDGELFFVFRQVGNGRPSQVRTGGGTWRLLDSTVNLIARENQAELFRISFPRKEFEEFSQRRIDPRQPNRPNLIDAAGKLYFSSRCPAQ